MTDRQLRAFDREGGWVTALGLRLRTGEADPREVQRVTLAAALGDEIALAGVAELGLALGPVRDRRDDWIDALAMLGRRPAITLVYPWVLDDVVGVTELPSHHVQAALARVWRWILGDDVGRLNTWATAQLERSLAGNAVRRMVTAIHASDPGHAGPNALAWPIHLADSVLITPPQFVAMGCGVSSVARGRELGRLLLAGLPQAACPA